MFYHVPSEKNSLASNGTLADEEKVPCLHCGRPILIANSKRTGGFCMPHWGHHTSFLETLGGVPQFKEELPQEKIYEALISRDTRLALSVLFSFMTQGDSLRLFSVKPEGFKKEYAKRGVALFRGGVPISGFVTEWDENPVHDTATEEACEEKLIATLFGERWPEFKASLPQDAEFIHYKTSPHSWACLCDREGYAVKTNGFYMWERETRIN